MEQFTAFIVLAVLVEGTVEYFLAGENRPWLKYVALALGILAAVTFNADILTVFGVTSAIPYAGSVATGLIIGRGSNYVHDFIKAIRNFGQNTVA